MPKKKDLTKSIERLEAMEDRLNVELSGLSAFIETSDDNIYLQVCGEVHTMNSGKLPHDLDIQIVAYDDSGRVVGNESVLLDSETFFGLDVFSVLLELPIIPIRVRIYPKMR